MEKIEHLKTEKGGAFNYLIDEKKLGEMVYVMSGEKTMIIEHTEVDDSLKGQGTGKKLLEQLVNYVREHHIKVVPLCPFANITFKRTKEWQDVL